MIYIPGAKSKKISLRIHSEHTEEYGNEEYRSEKSIAKLIECAEQGANVQIDELNALFDECGEKEEIELLTEARIRTNSDGLVEIVYRESEDDGQFDILSRIMFAPSSPDLVIMTKKGAVHSSLSFETGKTHVCSYVTQYMPFKVYVTSSTVDNRLLQSGKMTLEYTLRIEDTPPQRFSVNIRIEEEPEDMLKDFLSERRQFT